MIPIIDPQVKHVGISHLRKLNAGQLRSLTGALVICDNSEPLVVIVSYETFLRIQSTGQKLSSAVDYVVPRGLREKGDVKR